MCMFVGDSRPGAAAFVATDTRTMIDGVSLDPGGKIVSTGSGWATAVGSGRPFHVALAALRSAGAPAPGADPISRAAAIVSVSLSEAGLETRSWKKHPDVTSDKGVSIALIEPGSGVILLENAHADEGFHVVGAPTEYTEANQDELANEMLRDSLNAGPDLASRIRSAARHFERTHRASKTVSGTMEVGYLMPSPSGPLRGFLRGEASAIAAADPSEILERFSATHTGKLTNEILFAAQASAAVQRFAGVARAIVKGYQSGYTKDDVAGTGVVAFSPVFQNTPAIRLSAGKAANATFPYDNFAALGASASGFTCVAKNKSKGTVVGRTAEFTASLTATTVGAVTGNATLANAPSLDNNYKARYKIAVTCSTGPEQPSGSVTVVVAIEVSADGSTGWTEYATRSYSASRTTNGTTTNTSSGQEVIVNVGSLTSVAAIRLKFKSQTETGGAVGDGSATLTGYSNAGSDGHGVTYNTDAGVTYQTKTPDADDQIFWEAWEVVS